MAAKSITIKNFKDEAGGKLSEDRIRYEFPVVSSTKSNTGKKTTWQIYVQLAVSKDAAIDVKKLTVDNVVYIPILDEYFNGAPIVYKMLPAVAITNVLSKQEDSEKYSKKVPTIVFEGKNIGKSNQTNVLTQAIRDALGKHNKQNKTSSVEKHATRYPPMLLNRFRDKEATVDYADPNGIYVQPKENGVRTVITLENGQVTAYSREMSEYHGFKHIKEELAPVLKMWHETYNRKIYFDGEIFSEGIALQDIAGVARRSKTGVDEIKLNYNVFDIFIPGEFLNYAERKTVLDSILCPNVVATNVVVTTNVNEVAANVEKPKLSTETFKLHTECKTFKYIKYVPTYRVHTREEVFEYYEKFLEMKFEGLVLRKGSGLYRFSYNKHHCDEVLKLKPTNDSEFKIVDYTQANLGKSKGAIMLIFETEDGKRFPVTPSMTIDERKTMFDKMSKVEANGKTNFENEYKDKYATIQYDELSKDGIPLRIVMNEIVVRDYE